MSWKNEQGFNRQQHGTNLIDHLSVVLKQLSLQGSVDSLAQSGFTTNNQSDQTEFVLIQLITEPPALARKCLKLGPLLSETM